MPTETLATDWFRFLGMNIKGTPAMTAAQVAEDLAVGRAKSSVLVTQEFRWPWYWRTLRQTTLRGVGGLQWRSTPGMLQGFRAPVRGAQAVMWRTRRWKRVRTKSALLHHGEAGISEDRFIRAALLRDRETGLRCWFMTTHFVVGGDMATDGMRRHNMMAIDLAGLDKFLDELVATGHPIIGEIDANLRVQSSVFVTFRAIFRRYPGARWHGGHGVEWLFTIPGRTSVVEVKREWVIDTRQLNTDHEGRGITARLVAKGNAR